MEEKSKTGLNHENARTPEQQALMEQIEKDGVCPFCKEHFTKYHPKPVLHETDYWFVTENMSLYEGTTKHFLFVYKPSHVTHLEELPHDAMGDLHTALAWVTKTHHIEGGSFFMRFGDTSYNGSSVAHLHAQLVVGKKYSDGADALRVKLGWKT